MNKLFTLLLFLLFADSVNTQDIHFSHIHASPMAINPAMVGVFDGTARIIGNFRSQWQEITADYQTLMGSVDFKLARLDRNSTLGMGIRVASDVAGDLAYTTNSFHIATSWMQALNKKRNNYIILSAELGRFNNSYDVSRIVSHDYEPIIDLAGSNTSNYYDANVGLMWYGGIFRKDYIYIGTALHHLNTPNVSFVDEVFQENLYRRFVIHGGANFANDREVTYMPSFIYMNQGPHREMNIGSFMRYTGDFASVGSDFKASFMLGAWIRWYIDLDGSVGSDALIGVLRYNFGPMFISFSYDINISNLARVSFGRGGPEFSVIYMVGGDFKRDNGSGKRKKRSGAMSCPHF
ncbi:MAG: PorP/SprF family type IX secretion system membrane protein [Bacteroidota bacterium]